MRPSRSCILLVIAMVGAFAQAGQYERPANEPEQSVALIRNLYSQVVSRHPIGVISGADMNVFGPYLSRPLRHRIDLAAGCEADFYRKYPQKDLKPPLAWLELGLFSGGDEMAAPSAFLVERTRPVKQGVVRVYVMLTHAETNAPDWTRPVAVEVAREEGRYVVEDVIYLKGKDNRSDVWLSKVLAAGCNRGHWVGDGRR